LRLCCARNSLYEQVFKLKQKSVKNQLFFKFSIDGKSLCKIVISEYLLSMKILNFDKKNLQFLNNYYIRVAVFLTNYLFYYKLKKQLLIN